MTEKRWLYFALGVSTVISFGAVTNQLVPLAPDTGVALSDTGITFPDGTEQTTAAVDAGSVARNSVREWCGLSFSANSYSGSCSFDSVPAGKVLVVEFFSGEVAYPSQQTGDVDLFVGRGTSFSIHHQLPKHYQWTDSAGYSYYNVSQLVRLYLDEGEHLGVRVERNTLGTPSPWANFYLTGHYVDKLL